MKTNKLIIYLRKYYYILILIIVISLITIANFNLRVKLLECSVSKSSLKSLYSINLMIDSLEGLSISKEIFRDFNNINKTSKNFENERIMIFTKPDRSCGKCLLSILSILINNQVYKKLVLDLKPLIILNSNDQSIIAALEFSGYSKYFRVIIDPNFVNKITPKTSEGVCLFINNEGKIVFAEEMRAENTTKISRTFKKIFNDLNNILLY